MSAPLSNELFSEVHRGIQGKKVNEPLGMHWSAVHGLDTLNSRYDNQVGAVRFTGDQDFNNTLKPGKKGTIIHGLPEVKGTKWGKKGDKEFLREHGVYSAFTKKMKEEMHGMHDEGREEQEAEVPVRPGSKVLVTGITRVRAPKKGGEYKSRKIKYNPPREMKA